MFCFATAKIVYEMLNVFRHSKKVIRTTGNEMKHENIKNYERISNGGKKICRPV